MNPKDEALFKIALDALYAIQCGAGNREGDRWQVAIRCVRDTQLAIENERVISEQPPVTQEHL